MTLLEFPTMLFHLSNHIPFFRLTSTLHARGPIETATDTQQQQRWQRTKPHQPFAYSSSIYPLTH
jgi:hypothetical protein